MKFKDVTVQFGKFDADVVLEYTLCLQYTLAETGEELLYDELKMITSMTVRAEDDIVFIEILKHKIDVDNKYVTAN